ncbi:hypothetical protein IWQ62_003395 [Dispira parvispora]|uniref:RCC1-like domain-containing protein n=1 Tax=Dispira parvispora TaxID=1520584 RepID=A0A9W8AU90_9FUNG|nr:hypothetical protein IWQ62_003395 [Dispira parvispora]
MAKAKTRAPSKSAAATTTAPSRKRKTGQDEAPPRETSVKRARNGHVDIKSTPMKKTAKQGLARNRRPRKATVQAAKGGSQKPVEEDPFTKVVVSSIKSDSKHKVDDLVAATTASAKGLTLGAAETKHPAKKTKVAKKGAAEESSSQTTKPAPKSHHRHTNKEAINPSPVLPTEVGKVLVFGNGDCGQLGLGEDILQRKKPYPLQALDDEEIVDIAAGGLHNMALTKDGRLFSWGCNDQKALGREGDEMEPAEIKLEINGERVQFIKMACGDSVTVALTGHGVYSWGTYRSAEGLLGFNQEKEIQATPMLVAGIDDEIVDLSVGADHVLALTRYGEVYAWGNGQQHQIGRRIIERRKRNGLRPVKLGLKNVVHIGTGAFHSFAVTQKGELYTWGLNNFHQCGVDPEDGGDEPVVPMPTLVRSLSHTKVRQVMGGVHHTMVLTEDGAVYGFGRSDSHQVGLPYTSLPEDVEAMKRKKEEARKRAELYDQPFDEAEFSTHKKAISKPTLLPDCPKFATLGVGSNHNIGLTADGDIYSWGYGDMLALGNGEEEDEETPTLVTGKRLEDTKVIRIAAGGQHSVLLVQPK